MSSSLAGESSGANPPAAVRPSGNGALPANEVIPQQAHDGKSNVAASTGKGASDEKSFSSNKELHFQEVLGTVKASVVRKSALSAELQEWDSSFQKAWSSMLANDRNGGYTYDGKEVICSYALVGGIDKKFIPSNCDFQRHIDLAPFSAEAPSFVPTNMANIGLTTAGSKTIQVFDVDSAVSDPSYQRMSTQYKSLPHMYVRRWMDSSSKYLSYNLETIVRLADFYSPSSRLSGGAPDSETSSLEAVWSRINKVDSKTAVEIISGLDLVKSPLSQIKKNTCLAVKGGNTSQTYQRLSDPTVNIKNFFDADGNSVVIDLTAALHSDSKIELSLNHFLSVLPICKLSPKRKVTGHVYGTAFLLDKEASAYIYSKITGVPNMKRTTRFLATAAHNLTMDSSYEICSRAIARSDGKVRSELIPLGRGSLSKFYVPSSIAHLDWKKAVAEGPVSRVDDFAIMPISRKAAKYFEDNLAMGLPLNQNPGLLKSSGTPLSALVLGYGLNSVGMRVSQCPSTHCEGKGITSLCPTVKGDSGGPVLVNSNGEYSVAGCVSGNDDHEGNPVRVGSLMDFRTKVFQLKFPKERSKISLKSNVDGGLVHLGNPSIPIDIKSDIKAPSLNIPTKIIRPNFDDMDLSSVSSASSTRTVRKTLDASLRLPDTISELVHSSSKLRGHPSVRVRRGPEFKALQDQLSEIRELDKTVDPNLIFGRDNKVNVTFTRRGKGGKGGAKEIKTVTAAEVLKLCNAPEPASWLGWLGDYIYKHRWKFAAIGVTVALIAVFYYYLKQKEIKVERGKEKKQLEEWRTEQSRLVEEIQNSHSVELSKLQQRSAERIAYLEHSIQQLQAQMEIKLENDLVIDNNTNFNGTPLANFRFTRQHQSYPLHADDPAESKHNDDPSGDSKHPQAPQKESGGKKYVLVITSESIGAYNDLEHNLHVPLGSVFVSDTKGFDVRADLRAAANATGTYLRTCGIPLFHIRNNQRENITADCSIVILPHHRFSSLSGIAGSLRVKSQSEGFGWEGGFFRLYEKDVLSEIERNTPGDIPLLQDDYCCLGEMIMQLSEGSSFGFSHAKGAKLAARRYFRYSPWRIRVLHQTGMVHFCVPSSQNIPATHFPVPSPKGLATAIQLYQTSRSYYHYLCESKSVGSWSNINVSDHLLALRSNAEAITSVMGGSALAAVAPGVFFSTELTFSDRQITFYITIAEPVNIRASGLLWDISSGDTNRLPTSTTRNPKIVTFDDHDASRNLLMLSKLKGTTTTIQGGTYHSYTVEVEDGSDGEAWMGFIPMSFLRHVAPAIELSSHISSVLSREVIYRIWDRDSAAPVLDRHTLPADLPSF